MRNLEHWVKQVAAAMVMATLLLSVQTALAQGIPLHSGLLSYWPLSDGEGSVARDYGAAGTVIDNGQLRNSPSWIDGIFDAGLQFNGVNQDILLQNSTDMNVGANAVTLSAWVKLDQLPGTLPGAFGGIFDSSTDDYVFYLDKANNELRFKVTTASGAAERPGIPSSFLNTTSWHHIMGVYDGAGRANIYLNGQLIDSHAAPGLIGPVRTGQVASIGSQAGAPGNYLGSSFFKGGVADVALWNRPLGAAEAIYMYHGGVGNAVGAANPTIDPVVTLPPDNPSICVAAHRGYSVIAPENTLAAFTASAGFADRVEFDVQVSKDGMLVVMHDSTVNRTTNGTGSVSSLNYVDQLDGLDAGSWFSPAFAGEPIPTMKQSVETIFADGMVPLIERKSGSAAAYVNELTHMGILDDVVIIAFDWTFLAQVRALAPNVELGALGSGTLNASVISSIAAAGVDFVNWGDSGSLTRSTVDMVHAAGLEMHVWTVNSLGRMQQLIDLGVDGITTDDPETLRSLVPFPEFMAADFNRDGEVDGDDLQAWKTGFGATSGAGRASGDANGDGAVDGRDFLVWQRQFGSDAAASTAAPVPEPAAGLLAISVIATLLAARGTLGSVGKQTTNYYDSVLR